MSGKYKALKELFFVTRESDRANVQLALQSADKAVNKAEEAAEKRFEGLNELRNMANDQAQKYISVEVANEKFKTIDNVLADHGNRISSMEGRFLAVGTVSALAATAAVVIGFLS